MISPRDSEGQDRLPQFLRQHSSPSSREQRKAQKRRVRSVRNLQKVTRSVLVLSVSGSSVSARIVKSAYRAALPSASPTDSFHTFHALPVRDQRMMTRPDDNDA